jgi:predicted dehydrogenase
VAQVLRVGVLGAGWAGTGHTAAYRHLPDVEVCALWSRSSDRADALASALDSPRLQVYQEWEELITRGGCDVISIATPPMLRSAPFLLALEYGCHVLVEKPMSVGVGEAADMVAAAERSSTVTACCFNWRYAPALQAAKWMILDGAVGEIRDVRTEWFARLSSDFFHARPWSANMEVANGSLGEGLAHDLDKVRFLTGLEFLKIASVITPITIKQDTYLVDGGRSVHLVELTGGVLAQLGLSVTAGLDQWRLTVVGDEGSLTVPDEGTTLLRQRYDDTEPLVVNFSRCDEEGDSEDVLQCTWNALIADFVGAVRDNDQTVHSRPDLPTLTDGLRTEQVVAAARQSSAERRWVDIGE